MANKRLTWKERLEKKPAENIESRRTLPRRNSALLQQFANIATKSNKISVIFYERHLSVAQTMATSQPNSPNRILLIKSSMISKNQQLQHRICPFFIKLIAAYAILGINMVFSSTKLYVHLEAARRTVQTNHLYNHSLYQSAAA